MQHAKVYGLVGMIAIFLFLGTVGIWVTKTVGDDQCEQEYRHYYIQPVFRDSIGCIGVDGPCGILPNRIKVENAEIDMLRCYCRSPDTNKEQITQLLLEEFDIPQMMIGNMSDICEKTQLFTKISFQ